MVIAIIGLLASIVLVALNSARAKARDAKRKTDLHQIQVALELYYDKYGKYPCSEHNAYLTGSDWFSTTLKNEGLMSQAPSDTLYKGGGWGRDYNYFTPSDGSGSTYGLRAALETKNDAKTHNYPAGGTSCVTSGLPTCIWYGMNCIYDGYNPVLCGRTLHLGR